MPSASQSAGLCSFCERLPGVATTPNGKISCCQKCAASALPGLLAAALGEPGQIVRAVEFSTAGDVMSISTAPKQRRSGPMSRQELQRSLAATAARQRQTTLAGMAASLSLTPALVRESGQLSQADIIAATKRAGFQVHETTALSAAPAPARPATPPRRPGTLVSRGLRYDRGSGQVLRTVGRVEQRGVSPDETTAAEIKDVVRRAGMRA